MTLRANFDATATHKTISVAVAEAVALYPSTDNTLPFPITVRAKPGGGGGTLLVEYQIANGVDWTAWPAGAVALTTVMLLTGPLHALRFTAAGSTGTIEIIY